MAVGGFWPIILSRIFFIQPHTISFQSFEPFRGGALGPLPVSFLLWNHESLKWGRRSLDVRMFGVVLVDHSLGFIAVLSRLHLWVNGSRCGSVEFQSLRKGFVTQTDWFQWLCLPLFSYFFMYQAAFLDIFGLLHIARQVLFMWCLVWTVLAGDNSWVWQTLFCVYLDCLCLILKLFWWSEVLHRQIHKSRKHREGANTFLLSSCCFHWNWMSEKILFFRAFQLFWNLGCRTRRFGEPFVQSLRLLSRSTPRSSISSISLPRSLVSIWRFSKEILWSACTC